MHMLPWVLLGMVAHCHSCRLFRALPLPLPSRLHATALAPSALQSRWRTWRCVTASQTTSPMQHTCTIRRLAATVPACPPAGGGWLALAHCPQRRSNPARCAAHLSTRSTARSSASESCQSDRAFWASAAFTAPLKFSPDLAAISIATADNPSSTPASHGRAHRHRKPLPRALACWHSRAVCSEGPEPRAAPGMAARRRWRR